MASAAADIDAKADHVLYSFHGLPERHITRADPGGRCLTRADCCAALGEDNRDCYRAQCFATAARLAAAPDRAAGLAALASFRAALR